jgi:hypothetical protein
MLAAKNQIDQFRHHGAPSTPGLLFAWDYQCAAGKIGLGLHTLP